MEKIIEEKSVNPKTEDLPKIQTYYLGLGKREDCDWHNLGWINTNKEKVISDIKRDFVGYDEYKIISFELPF